MRINNEKRREVASKLRSEAEGWRDLFPDATPEGEGIDAAIMFDLIRFIGLDDLAPVHAIYARLANLIDRPTCKNASARENNEFLCSECRCQLEVTRVTDISPDGSTLMTENVIPAFCPVCGAKVVE